MMSSQSFDFIIVGAGTSGSLLASRLVSTKAAPSILLIEGGPNTLGDDRFRASFDRFATFMLSADVLGTDHTCSIISNPLSASGKPLSHDEAAKVARSMPYARGKGLGETSQVNFSCWCVGPAANYDTWARLVGDDVWKWENVRKIYDRIAKVHADHVGEDVKQLIHIDPASQEHTSHSKFDLEYPRKLEPEMRPMLAAAETFGWKTIKDINDGDPIGNGLAVNVYRHGLRTTTGTAFLTGAPQNLTIWTGTNVAKVLFHDMKAIGVQLMDGRTVHANKEVILSAGALDTPKLLLLSGIGPSTELTKHNIPLIAQVPGIGQNIGDHPAAQMTVQGPSAPHPAANTRVQRFFDTAGAQKARDSWAHSRLDASHTYRNINDSVIMGFHKHPRTNDDSALALLTDPIIRKHVMSPTAPDFETMFAGVLLPFPGLESLDASDTVYTLPLVLQNPQSKGTVTLASADAKVPPRVDLNFFSHPWDVRNAIDSGRALLRFIRSEPMKELVMKELFVPASDSDEDIYAFLRDTCLMTWHASGTVKMGRVEEDEMACVDNEFRVRGVKGLRVVDTSVMPFVVSNHAMSTALLIGQVAAEKLIAEYALDA